MLRAANQIFICDQFIKFCNSTLHEITCSKPKIRFIGGEPHFLN